MKRQLPPGFSKAVLIGQGAFGTVLRARQDDLGRWVALKQIASGDSAARDEAQALAATPLSCLPTVFGLVGIRRCEWICMEYVHGISLRDAMMQGLDSVEASAFAISLVRSTAVLHGAGRGHGDLKPENVIVEPDGRVRLVDLGLSNVLTENVQGGTVGYMAPERGLSGCDPRRADLWSLGVLIHELLVGVRPTPSDVASGWKRLRNAALEWVPVVDLLFRGDPSRRPVSAVALLAELPEIAAPSKDSLEKLHEQADRNLASRMVDEAALLLRDDSPREALWLLQQALDLDPDQSEALGLLPQVRLDKQVETHSNWIGLGLVGLAVLTFLLIIGFASHRHRAGVIGIRARLFGDSDASDRVRSQQAPRRNESLPLREGRGDSK